MEKNEKKEQIPLSILMENTKGKMTAAVNQSIEESGLPAYLIEGILTGILAEVRNQKNLELISDYNRMKALREKEGEE